MAEPLAPPSAAHQRTPEQGQAADPARQVWVEASAGTGKTQVLTDRILRLMLAGVAPERILALTFTRAAAAEMVNRLTKTLARWQGLDDAMLAAELAAMQVRPATDALIRARQLFARVLDLPAGLPLQTLHSFAQGLLATFPLEAGLVPGFVALDERDSAVLRKRALTEAIVGARAAGQQWFLDDLGELALIGGERGLESITATLLRHGGTLERFTTPDALPAVVERVLGVPAGAVPGEGYRAGFAPGGEIESSVRDVAAALRAWGTKTGLADADTLDAWLAGDADARVAERERLWGVLFSKGEPKKFTNARKSQPQLEGVLERLGPALLDLERRESAIACADVNTHALRVGQVLATRYRALKNAEGAIDYDDMIAGAARLLGTPGVPDWIRYKLDSRFDHVLVDEAQDTNRRQWTIIRQLIEDYFADRERRRTLFVVGDMKQSIYRFQGTEPEVFEAQRRELTAAARDANSALDHVALGHSFRSGPAVLDFVNAFLTSAGPDALGLAEAPPPHIAHRAGAGGEVVLWPLVLPPEGDASDDNAEDNTDDDSDPSMAAAEAQSAKVIAAEVKRWLTPGPGRMWLPAHGRFVQPKDILILLRRRSHVMLPIVRELHRLKVAVAGVDRLLLTEPLVVQDLIALMRFATQPEDDLNLANLLVSPFVGWADYAGLRAIAHGRGAKSLWQRLRESDAPPAGEASAFLRKVLNLADRVGPYAFLDEILSGVMEGRRRLLERLGTESEQAIDALLGQALVFEETHAPALAGFLDWLTGDRFEVTREPDSAEDKVRLMTIHGAKGLEAPVVILADTGIDPKRGQSRGPRTVELPLPQGGKLPFLTGAKPYPDVIDAQLAADADADGREDMRLLYVALTRAADHLFIGGAIGRLSSDRLKPETDGRWHSILARVFDGMDGTDTIRVPTMEGEVRRIRRGTWTAPATAQPVVEPETGALTHYGPLRLDPAPPVGPLAPPLRPSRMPEGENDGPATAGRKAAAERGRLMHRLFEKLPDVTGDRTATAIRWLAGQGVEGAAARAMADEALAVLAQHPEFFVAGSLAEAPVAGIVGGQVVTGVIDRLVAGKTVAFVDFKTGLHVPATAERVPLPHLEQMALYAALLRAAFPGRAIRASLLYTAGPRLIFLPEPLLDAALRNMGGARSPSA